MSVQRFAVLGAVTAVTLASCGSPSQSPAVPAPSPVTSPVTTVDGSAPDIADPGGDWVATSGVTNGVAVEPIDGWDVTVSIDGAEIDGTAACNGYGGDVTVGADGSFVVGEINITEMGCQPDVQALEQAFVAALGSFTNFDVTGDALTLSSPNDEWVFDRLAPVDDAAVVGTTWVLDTYIAEGASTNAPGMESAFLLLNGDGTVTGSTGCRALTGEWVEAGAEIVFTQLSAIDDPTAGQCAPDAEQLDGRVISVLEGGLRSTVEGNRLTVMAQGGEGLSFTAG